MNALFERLDPRTRIVIVVLSVVIVSSSTPGALLPFAFYLPLTIALVVTSRASWRYLVWRCLQAIPFVLLAAGLLAFQDGFEREQVFARFPAAASVFLRGFNAVLLLSFLTATTPLSQLLWALRKMHAPQSLNLILSVMYRYTSLLSDEYDRLGRARESRTVRPLGNTRYAIHGRQLGTLLLRSWDRAERIHAAMLSRGFNGGWPALESPHLTTFDVCFGILAVLPFLAIRLFI